VLSNIDFCGEHNGCQELPADLTGQKISDIFHFRGNHSQGTLKKFVETSEKDGRTELLGAYYELA
jgi:hypothetical protein